MKKLIGLLLASGILLVPGAFVLAQQGIYKGLLDLPMNLANDADREAVRQLLGDALTNQPDGMTTSWRNPDTGTYALVKVLESYQNKSLPCRKVKMRTSAGDQKRDWQFNFCQVEDGSWKIAP